MGMSVSFFDTAKESAYHYGNMQCIICGDAQRLLFGANPVDGGRVKVLNHPVRVAILCILQRLIDKFEGTDSVERIAALDLFDHPLIELVRALSVTVILIKLRGAGILRNVNSTLATA